MGDLIDREQALSAFDTDNNELIIRGSENADTVEQYLKRVMYKIESLPSAELGKNLAEVGTDCISRRAAIDALKKQREELLKGLDKNSNVYGIISASTGIMICTVGQLPSAEPEIIRCKDCKHWIPYDWMFSEIWRSRNMADYLEDEIGCDCCDMAMKANDFCSRSEKKEVTE